MNLRQIRIGCVAAVLLLSGGIEAWAGPEAAANRPEEVVIVPSAVGFAVIYRWRLKPGLEAQFQDAWERFTVALKTERGALGSRLHRAEDGSWIAYAQWPSRELWQQSRTMDPVDLEAAALMLGAVEASDDPILLEPVLDHLAPAR